MPLVARSPETCLERHEFVIEEKGRHVRRWGWWVDFRWSEWNVEHLARHGVDPEAAEEA
jgi:hypothetical protein